MRKPKLFELDLVRAVAIAAVLIIHGTASATVDIPATSRSQLLYDIVNKLSNFAVPLFLILSGLVLFYSYMDTWKVKNIWTFYRKRLQYILIPYLIWSFFYYVFYPAITPGWGIEIKWLDFLDKLRWAETSYHLYFMIIIMQFYALFPLVITLAKYWKLFRNYLWVFGILIQGAAFAYNLYVEPIAHRDAHFLTYIALFFIGGSLGLHYAKIMEWLNRNIWWVPAATVATGFLFFLLLFAARQGINYGAYSYEVLFNLYPVGIALSSIWIGRRLLTSAPRTSRILSSMGAASFGIYFIHPALLQYWAITIQAGPLSAAYHGEVFGGLILLFTVPWLIVLALKKVPGNWILLGK
ncbi:MAG: acyltransferase [Paenibacillus sp.]|nr:acyltransferase [Paenibacillus sp.]